ncbi:MAG: hypothetical protein MET45_03445 [Nostoc sp. LLA-1]|nr:hypothetical protein [Cyanocohniella sp. LLY]
MLINSQRARNFEVSGFFNGEMRGEEAGEQHFGYAQWTGAGEKFLPQSPCPLVPNPLVPNPQYPIRRIKP